MISSTGTRLFLTRVSLWFLVGIAVTGCRVAATRTMPWPMASTLTGNSFGVPNEFNARGLTGNDSKSPSNVGVRLVSFRNQEGTTSAASTVNQPISDELAAAVFPESQVADGSLASFLQRALSSHPKILAARARVCAAQHRIPQATALDDPMVETMFWPIQANAQQLASGRMTNQLDFSQEIPYPEKRRTKGAIAEREVQIVQAEADLIEREIAESVRLAYYELWFATRAMEIVTNSRDVASQLVKAAEARYRAEGSQQDVIRAELETEKIDQQLLELAQQKADAQADLAALIQDPLAPELTAESALPIQDIPQQLEQLIAQAEQCSPELRGLAWQIERDRENQRLACLQKYPDLRLGMQYGMMTTGGAISPQADGIDNISFSVGVTLPIWREKIRAGICEASAQQISSSRLLEAQQLTISGNLRRLIAEANSLEQQRVLFVNRITPKAEQALQVATSEYVVGKTTFAQLVDNYSEVLTFQLQTARLEASLAGTLAQIQKTMGCN